MRPVLSAVAHRSRLRALAVAVSLCGVLVGAGAGPTKASTSDSASPAGLVPTLHEPVPALWSELWLVPEAGFTAPRAWQAVADGFRSLEAGSAADALAKANEAVLARSPLTGYAHLLAGQALQRLQRPDDARIRLDAARAAGGDGALYERASTALAELELAAGAPARATQLFKELLGSNPIVPTTLLAGLVRSAEASGDRARMEAAAIRLYYEYATSPEADGMAATVAAVRAAADPARLADLDALEVQRGEQLFVARRYGDARSAFERARPTRAAGALPLVDLRIAQCDHFLKRHQAAIDRLLPLIRSGPHAAEAAYHLALAYRASGHRDRYVALVDEMTTRFQGSPWTAEALNHVASFHLVASDLDRAFAAFSQLLRDYPAHRHAERAAWRLGWARYREGRFVEAATTFDQGARNAPRSDYRPAWLYWSGRAYEQARDLGTALQRYTVAVEDYQHSYYGRLAADAMARVAASAGRAASPVASAATGAGAGVAPQSSRPSMPGNAEVVRALLAVGLLDFAETELRFAERAWGNAPLLLATQAWIHNRRGELRRGINAMRRAYPQFLTASGHLLPVELQQVIFPVDYWSLIRRYAEARQLDPFLVAALVAQESTFQADARSVANALGLMQIIPATGRRLAQQEGIRPFRTSALTNPEINVRLGTRYLASLLQRLGEAHLALASYNAGSSRVVRWAAEKQGLPADEFIDDIPFPETQNYVKRILGTVEDYRRLYGANPAATPARPPAAGTPAGPGGVSRNSSSVAPAATGSPGAKRSAATRGRTKTSAAKSGKPPSASASKKPATTKRPGGKAATSQPAAGKPSSTRTAANAPRKSTRAGTSVSPGRSVAPPAGARR